MQPSTEPVTYCIGVGSVEAWGILGAAAAWVGWGYELQDINV